MKEGGLGSSLANSYERDRGGLIHEHYTRLVNGGLVGPQVIPVSSQEGLEQYDDCVIVPVDYRLENTVALFERFNPGVMRQGESDAIKLAFEDWLKGYGLKASDLVSDTHDSLFTPVGIPKKGYNKPVYHEVALLPESLYRLEQSASISKLLDNPTGEKITVNGKEKTTSEVLWEDTEFIVIGCSVGSQIIEALGMLNIQHGTIIDRNTYDAVVRGRMLDPDVTDDGKQKVVKTQHNFIKAHPRAKLKTIVGYLTSENAMEILRGQIRNNPGRRLVIFEEVDDEDAKRNVRKKVRELYEEIKIETGEEPHILLGMISDEGRTANGIHVEVIGEDKPFNGTPEQYFPGNPYAEGLPRPVGMLAMVGFTQGKSEKKVGELSSQDVGLSMEMPGALQRLLEGKIGSFEQSGLASRSTGINATAIVLAWLEGHLSKDSRNTKIDPARTFDDRYQNQEYLERALRVNMILENKIFGTTPISLK